jgi:hypothetical protein
MVAAGWGASESPGSATISAETISSSPVLAVAKVGFAAEAAPA